ncbi:aspartate-semialdehyde dehydrogenase [Siccirubricoccus sp. KC 17139]|uniref:Aspartate-semialdehyde dehydrogenase n=1 Tax=Siccirubricoccus soli TaxID=2899147 RepID=A0ABT1DCR4_9PROT|nr:aspartate-semialdehyde dehydrogenase [Siccirubricoccus soli]MCO6418979.1 aspartate-semialdehyde dehydrogenase [Siccirubricoccus soli]MCP2685114.1 aspartate-semialdehyde dehydrogenase [Siccirubricoccus soli]
MPDTLPPSLAAAARAGAARLPQIAILGATGAVGHALLESLESRGFPVGGLRLLASPRSAGQRLPFRGQEITVEALGEDSFKGIDLAFFSAGATLSRQSAPLARAAGAVVVDNSSAFRMDPAVPLVVPEVNAAALAGHAGLIANPNCVAAIATVALAPLHRALPIRRLSMATYQAASGAGAAAMAELEQATAAALRGEAFTPRVLPHPYAFNLFSHNATMDPETGHNGEELKVVAETRRIMGLPELPIGITCIRVPVLRAHAMAITLEFDEPMAPERARALLEAAPGLRVVDDAAANHYPMPVEASGREEVLVGRIRRDLGDPSGRSLAIFVVGDQLLKGAALNAVQIAELVLRG